VIKTAEDRNNLTYHVVLVSVALILSLYPGYRTTKGNYSFQSLRLLTGGEGFF
jgi:hypothetical protein